MQSQAGELLHSGYLHQPVDQDVPYKKDVPSEHTVNVLANMNRLSIKNEKIFVAPHGVIDAFFVWAVRASWRWWTGKKELSNEVSTSLRLQTQRIAAGTWLC